MFLFCLTVVGIIIPEVSGGQIRGVSQTRSSFYQPTEKNEFGCLDGSGMIPFDQVNDDFCDCPDGSDEPGTSACPNGFFHCPNAGFKPLNLFSSRVNDMICDCCDGSDEWGGYVTCPNTCKELYKQYYAERIKSQEEAMEGYKIRENLANDAKAEKDKLAGEKEELESQLETIRIEKNELEELKIKAEEEEEAERDRLEKLKLEKVIEKAKDYSEEELIKISFDFLDTNNNEEIAVYELTSKKYLNPKDSKSFAHADARELMQEKEPMSRADFETILWPEIKEKIIPHLGNEFKAYDRNKELEAQEATEADDGNEETEQGSEDSLEDEPEEAEILDSEMEELKEDLGDFEDEDDGLHDDYDDDRWEDEDDWDAMDDDYDDYGDYNQKKTYDDDHDEDTSPESEAIFSAARTARDNFNEVNDKYKDTESRIEFINEQLKFEFGENDIFITMYKVCFEMKTSEYVYKICPYEKATQKPLHGGSETNLGKWDSWNDDFTEMKFTRGTRCWNGPDRSTTVKVKCGKENKLLSVDEPNRCEYEYKFETPTVCKKPEPIRGHDEL